MTKRSTLLTYLATAAAVVGVVVCIETAVRLHERAAERIEPNVPAMMEALATSTISGREIGNQMLAHNIALFSRHPSPQKVDTAYVGTSRTKVLRPGWMGQSHAVNASGNSYNEISYGLLLQAEVARLRFPNLKRVYVEASLLLRRPDRLIVEPDHRKYLPLLESVAPLRAKLPDADRFQSQLAQARVAPQQKKWRLQFVERRDDIRISRLFPRAGPESGRAIPVTDDLLFTQLGPDGQRKGIPPAVVPKARQPAEIGQDHVKVQRLRDIQGWAPWDGLFDVIALWGRAHGIEIVMFQPPVRSDLYKHQQQTGIAAHVADLDRISRQYGIAFIDLNRPELGYMNDWAIFSDEDHMETCVGIVLFQAALEAGVMEFHRSANLMPLITRDQAQRQAATRLSRCDGPAAI